ncbi:unnamed protein product [Gordionus sp. m RMFG-2023]|uniref:DDRGK domain-containing protein 1-like n=1 Tax=Gordionus sp. m RMFG-2023 TaxID=3053472 RepID=UPI0030DF87C4
MKKEIGIDSSVYNILILISLSVVILAIILIKFVLNSFKSNKILSVNNDVEEIDQIHTLVRNRTRGRGLQRLRTGLSRIENFEMASRSNLNTCQENTENDTDISENEDIMAPNKKIGTKKMKKLELKAEKKAQREQEISEREEKKKREAISEQKRLAEEEKNKQLEKQIELEEKRNLEEIKRKEEIEYQNWKKEFEIQEEGCDETLDFDKNVNLLQDFINYCKENKIVILEDLASHFKLKVQDVIQRIEDLVKVGTMNGVFDDRGKFIYITDEELLSVAKFIEDKGRVSIIDLVQHSNRLINLDQKI